MSDESEASVIGSLPHSRPQRRSEKRAARPAPKRAAAAKRGAAPPAADQAAPAQPGPAQQPAADQAAPAQAEPDRAADTPGQQEQCGCPASLADATELVGTLVRAAAEVAEIGLTIGARALRNAVSRLPKP